jgi:hypothetical protein
VSVELPVLIAVGAKPVSRIVVVLVGEAHGDAIAAEGPEFLDEPVVELAVPLPRQEGDDLGASVEELAAVSPMTVDAVGERDPFRVAAVPGVLGRANLLMALSSVNGGSGGRSSLMLSLRSLFALDYSVRRRTLQNAEGPAPDGNCRARAILASIYRGPNIADRRPAFRGAGRRETVL